LLLAALPLQLYFLDLAREHYSRNQQVVKQRMSQEEKDLFGQLVYDFYEEQIKEEDEGEGGKERK
jgi:hypothetical protein